MVAIERFLARHQLDADEWYGVIERSYLKAVSLVDSDSPVLAGFAYWMMRNELYCEMRKEYEMGSNGKFLWSPQRREVLEEMCHAGKSIVEIAVHFGVAEETVLAGISKYHIAQAVDESSFSSADTDSEERAFSAQTGSLKRLRHLRHLTGYANSLRRDAVQLFLDDRCHEAFYALGKQELLLKEALELISALIPTPEP